MGARFPPRCNVCFFKSPFFPFNFWSGIFQADRIFYLDMALQEVNRAFEIGCLLSNQDFLRNKATVFCQIVQILSSSQQRMEPQLTMGAARCHWFANNTLPLSPGTEIINLLKWSVRHASDLLWQDKCGLDRLQTGWFYLTHCHHLYW